MVWASVYGVNVPVTALLTVMCAHIGAMEDLVASVTPGSQYPIIETNGIQSLLALQTQLAAALKWVPVRMPCLCHVEAVSVAS